MTDNIGDVKIIAFSDGVRTIDSMYGFYDESYVKKDNFLSLFLSIKYSDDNIVRLCLGNMDFNYIDDRIRKATRSGEKITFIISDINLFSESSVSFLKSIGSPIVKIYTRPENVKARHDSDVELGDGPEFDSLFNYADFNTFLCFENYFDLCSKSIDIYTRVKSKRKLPKLLAGDVETEKTTSPNDRDIIELCTSYFNYLNAKKKVADNEYINSVYPIYLKRKKIEDYTVSFIDRNLNKLKKIPPALLNKHLSNFIPEDRGFYLLDNTIYFMDVDIRQDDYTNDLTGYRDDEDNDNDASGYVSEDFYPPPREKRYSSFRRHPSPRGGVSLSYRSFTFYNNDFYSDNEPPVGGEASSYDDSSHNIKPYFYFGEPYNFKNLFSLIDRRIGIGENIENEGEFELKNADSIMRDFVVNSYEAENAKIDFLNYVLRSFSSMSRADLISEVPLFS